MRNNKQKKVIPIDQLEALDVPHYPYTFVIADMRLGNQAILVQQKSSAFKNPDEVAALVTDYCSRVLQLSSLGLMMRLDKALQMVLVMMCAAQGELKLSTNDDAKELLSESREDVRNMVDMLIKNKYHLKVGFEKSGSVEYGSETAAIYGVDDTWCLEYIAKEPHIEDNPDGAYHLFGWLIMLMPGGAGYAYKESVRRSRNGSNKRACRA